MEVKTRNTRCSVPNDSVEYYRLNIVESSRTDTNRYEPTGRIVAIPCFQFTNARVFIELKTKVFVDFTYRYHIIILRPEQKPNVREQEAGRSARPEAIYKGLQCSVLVKILYEI